MYRRSFLDKLEAKFGKFAIRNLMPIIVGAMGIVFVMDFVVSAKTGYSMTQMLVFDRSAIFAGQVWRLITFIFLPPDSSVIFIIFALYFYWLIGSSLESEWGAFKFNVFYLTGIIGTVIAGLITGYATNSFINLTLLLAFAIVYPNYEILLFFFIPVKMKFIAFADAAIIAILFFTAGLGGKAAIFVSLINIALFFGSDLIRTIKRVYMNIKYKINTRRK